MKMMKFNAIQFVYILDILLLLLCLLPMSYGYYILVRFVVMATSIYFAYMAFTEDSKKLGFVFVTVALLFQPFVKIPLGRTIWNIVDVVLAVFLIVLSIGIKSTKKTEEEQP